MRKRLPEEPRSSCVALLCLDSSAIVTSTIFDTFTDKAVLNKRNLKSSKRRIFVMYTNYFQAVVPRASYRACHAKFNPKKKFRLWCCQSMRLFIVTLEAYRRYNIWYCMLFRLISSKIDDADDRLRKWQIGLKERFSMSNESNLGESVLQYQNLT
jgi:hypothetical protein